MFWVLFGTVLHIIFTGYIKFCEVFHVFVGGLTPCDVVKYIFHIFSVVLFSKFLIHTLKINYIRVQY